MSRKRARELLTSEQRLEFLSIPDQISEYELGSHYTLSPHDIKSLNFTGGTITNWALLYNSVYSVSQAVPYLTFTIYQIGL